MYVQVYIYTCNECVLSSAIPQSSTDAFSLLLTLASSDIKLSVSCVCKVHQMCVVSVSNFASVSKNIFKIVHVCVFCKP